MIVRKQIVIRGVVQGVGFRPHVFRLADQHGLTGFVRNDTAGVFLEVQGPNETMDVFLQEIVSKAPKHARIDSLFAINIPVRQDRAFVIVNSQSEQGAVSSIPPDMAHCRDCQRELYDTTNRRFGYPFINCTHCGPRYTLIRSLPYDRPGTTMASFEMCPACATEYRNPADRRFHAQPIACSECGPHVWLEADEVLLVDKQEAIAEAKIRIRAGQVLAIKGIGGFHLACDATNCEAVARLRTRKGRGGKPFAVMVKNLEHAQRLARISQAEAMVLASPERPVVILKRRQDDNTLAAGVAPGVSTIGLLLPYSPLHELLLEDQPWVMTSGNRSNEPIVSENQDAKTRLTGIADGFLMHDREIHTECDDSVIQVVEQALYPVRRSRGYVPLPVRLPGTGRPVLAVGGELKSTLCVTVGDKAYLSQHLGDVESPETLATLDRTAEHLLKLFQITPECVACDLHPGYRSSEWARRWAQQRQIPLVEVQHHHAHLASLWVESGKTDKPMLAACFDGTGYGPDRTIWGGEFLLAGAHGTRRIGHWDSVRLPAEDEAVRRPYRLALAYLKSAAVAWHPRLPCVAACSAGERRLLAQRLDRNFGCIPSSSVGRLFDAVASILGICQNVTYEAQAAIEMEALVESADVSGYPVEVQFDPQVRVGVGSLIVAVVQDYLAGVSVQEIAARFHATLAEVVCRVACEVRKRVGTNTTGLTGGVFQNQTLLQATRRLLIARGFDLLQHQQVPTNDGGLALGQAAIAAGVIPAEFQWE